MKIFLSYAHLPYQVKQEIALKAPDTVFGGLRGQSTGKQIRTAA